MRDREFLELVGRITKTFRAGRAITWPARALRELLKNGRR